MFKCVSGPRICGNVRQVHRRSVALVKYYLLILAFLRFFRLRDRYAGQCPDLLKLVNEA